MTPIEDAFESASTLRAGLARIRRRWFLDVWLRVAARWGVATLLATAAAASLIALLDPAGPALVWAVASVPLVSAIALVVLAWGWWRPPTDRQVARFAEERHPDLEERLLSAADLLEVPAPTVIERLVLAAGAETVTSLDVDRVLPGRQLARRALQCAAVVAGVIAVTWIAAPQLRRAWQTARAQWFPATLSMHVAPGDVRVAEGDPVPVRVRIEGVPAADWISPVAVLTTAPHLREVPPLGASPDGSFAVDLPAGTASFTYRVTSGKLVSPEYSVTVRRRPRVDRVAVRYEYPSFSGLSARRDDDSGDVFGPAGTRVTVEVHTVDPVAGGSLAMTGLPAVPLVARGERALEGQFTLTADTAYRVGVRDGEGLSGTGDTEYFVRVMDDRPPDVRILRPGGDARVTRLEEVVIEARADDDYGVSRFELVYAPRGADERVVPLSRGTGTGGTSVTGQHTIYVEDLDVRPGDFVTYYARARDVGRGKRPTETRSDIFFLEVRPFNEEFEAAQSQAGMGGAGGSFDDLARLQKDIIVATWRLERRRAGGQSAEDVRAIAKSQADVKTRAEGLAQRLVAPTPSPRRGRPTPPTPPSPGPSPSPAPESPMKRAVEAMTSALRALESLDTKGALPHENEALNQLLKAQAEVRRRQVARQQQSSRGGGGGQSGNQDLSALFDRELQRQQQTNYEQRASSEQREERPEDESLRRLRELAARQDQLSRDQRELARRQAQLTPEEAKRRLERLTREQEELRRQAEQLARRMQQPGARQDQPSSSGERAQSQEGQQQSPGQGQGAEGAASQGSEQAQRMREAAGEMAGAAGELQRESPEAASQRAQRALDRLRSAERSLQGAQPDERRRLAGELQVEARELADAERRLANRADAAGADREAIRRLAGEQAGLADRADALERDARELATGASAASKRPADARTAEALRRAARGLTSERVGQRLRASSEAAQRGATSSPDPSTAAREMASTGRSAVQPLERLADALGEATGQDAETRRLSESLAETRGVRERLAEADRAPAQPSQREPGDAPGASGRSPAPGRPQSQAGSPSRSGSNSEGEAQGDTPGQRGDGGQGGEGQAGRAQADFLRELRERRDLLDALQRENPDLARAMSAMEGWTPSRSAPGTEPWKQDRARWDQLKKDVALALERYEASLAGRLAAREARDRLDAGGDDRPPDAWRAEVADYFRAVARKPQR